MPARTKERPTASEPATGPVGEAKKPKRGQGEGSVYEHKDNRKKPFEIRVTVNGKRRSFFYETEAKANRELRKKLHDRDRGALPSGPDQTLAAYLTRWLADVAKHTVRESTYESYEQHVRRHVVPAIGKVKLQKLTAQDLQAFYSKMLGEGLSPSTVQKQHAILHRALDQAMRWDLVGRNVADLVDAPRPVRREMHPLSSEEVSGFLAAAKGDRLHALYVLAVSTGLRQGELLGLGWADVDLDAATIRVTRQMRHQTGKATCSRSPRQPRGAGASPSRRSRSPHSASIGSANSPSGCTRARSG